MQYLSHLHVAVVLEVLLLEREVTNGYVSLALGGCGAGEV
jgi:hypothetical protein